MRKKSWLGLIFLAVFVGLIGVGLREKLAPSTPPSPPLMKLEEMGHLVSVRIRSADVIEISESRSFDIPWAMWEFRYAGTRVLLIAKGDCLIATDLRAAKYESIDEANRSVTVVLQPPKVLQARVNHAPPEQGGSRFYAISNLGIEAILPGSASRTKAINSALRLAQENVERTGRDAESLRLAKANAEEVLRGTLSALGWKVKFDWR